MKCRVTTQDRRGGIGIPDAAVLAALPDEPAAACPHKPWCYTVPYGTYVVLSGASAGRDEPLLRTSASAKLRGRMHICHAMLAIQRVHQASDACRCTQPPYEREHAYTMLRTGAPRDMAGGKPAWACRQLLMERPPTVCSSF